MTNFGPLVGCVEIDKDANVINSSLKIAAYCSLILITACSSMNPKAIDNVQSVAFIGFDVALNPNSISQTQNSDQLARTFQSQVKESFARELNWHITENAKLANNSVYQGFYHQYKSRLVQEGLVEDNQLRQAEASELAFEERERLINSLKVDAIAIMYISTPTLKKVVNQNLTTTFFEAHIDFSLYEKGNKNSIWKTLNITGNNDASLSYVTNDKNNDKPIKPESLTLTKMLNGEGIRNRIEQFLSNENTPALIDQKFKIMQDAITVSTDNLIKEYQQRSH